MKYTIELTDKQRKRFKHMNKALIKMGMGFDILSLLEPIKTINVENTNEYQIGYKVGYEDGKKYEDASYQRYYDKGLEDVNHAIEVLTHMTVTECEEWFDDCVGVDEVVCGFSVQRIVEITKAYEEKKKAEEETIKVGDEVKDLASNNIGVVLSIGQPMIIYMTKINRIYSNTRGSLEKTGRHFEEVSLLLNKLRGTEDEHIRNS